MLFLVKPGPGPASVKHKRPARRGQNRIRPYQRERQVLVQEAGLPDREIEFNSLGSYLSTPEEAGLEDSHLNVGRPTIQIPPDVGTLRRLVRGELSSADTKDVARWLLMCGDERMSDVLMNLLEEWQSERNGLVDPILEEEAELNASILEELESCPMVFSRDRESYWLGVEDVEEQEWLASLLLTTPQAPATLSRQGEIEK